VTGLSPRIEADRLVLSLVGDQKVVIPLDRISEISFSSGGGGLLSVRNVLAWGRYSDRNEEFPRTIAVLKEGLGPRWTINESFADKFDDASRRELFRSRALVVAELQDWNGSEASRLAAELRPLAESFLRRGGNIVLLGITGNQSAFIKDAGLLDVQATSNESGGQVPFTEAGRRIAAGIGGSFQQANSTQFYRIGTDIKAESFAGDPNGRAAVVARKVGRGWVILMGMDYYESNDTTKKLLINAVSYK
jgi:hypothetical protein